MKVFTQIAAPHDDIVEGRLTMDVFAADLWQVAIGKAPMDYQDPDLFFRKTYLTNGLKNILEIARKRLEGKSGDSVIQLTTPFGGGKTHTLVALYHKAKEWNVKVVVFDGTALNPEDVKPWEEIERQLTGNVLVTKGDISPGKDKIINLLSQNAPVLILMDEILEYTTKAAGVKVGDSNLASQTVAFIQELTGAVATIGNALLVVTLPSSIIEHYDENAERAFQQLQKITGRVETIYTPVEDEEIESVIRARLFSRIDEKEVKRIVNDFVEYAKNENLLSEEELTAYRERFVKSYPFKPEVIDVLYKRWGSFPTFQRTRGVLRLLSLVVHSLLDTNLPFIRLGDFNLSNNEIRRELIKHIGQEWDSIIAQDITSRESGAKKVDESLGTSYKSYRLGTVVSTTIFMTSFSGKGERGTSVKEIKLSTLYPDLSSTVIDTVINNLKEKLFYLSDEGLFFINQPNLNRIIVTREENISTDKILEEERRVLETHISKQSKFKVYLYPRFPKDIPDTPELKLVVLDTEKPDIEFIEKCGDQPRVYRNVLVFLCVNESQKEAFHSYLRKYLVLKSIESDKRLKLTEGQKNEVKKKLKNFEQREYEELRKYYRKLYLPVKEGYKEIDIGLPTYGEFVLDIEIYEHLRSKGEILEKVAPEVIKNRYLCEKDHIELKNLYEAFLKTPGEIRLISRDGFIEGIRQGVKKGLFGFGHIIDGKIECTCINDVPEVRLVDGEIIIKPELCQVETGDEEGEKSGGEAGEGVEPPPGGGGGPEPPPIKKYSKVYLKLEVPVGQLSTIAKIMNYLQSKFEKISLKLIIQATGGELEVTDYQDKILEALKQAGIKIEEESRE